MIQASPMAPVAHTNGYEFTQGSGYALPEYPFVAPEELTTAKVVRHRVVVVGAGITGLTLACSLAQSGVAAVVLDEDNTVGVKGASSRGICYTQKSLEIFEQLGIYQRIRAKGIEWSVGRTFAGHDEVFSFDLGQQSHFNLSEQPPFINIQQFYIEGFLVERIQALKRDQPTVDLRWQSRVVGFSQNEEVATLEVETPAGNYRIEAEHVIDATGSHTPFHAWCQASMDAKRGDDRWCIADVRFKHTPPTERHTWIEAPFNENRAVWQHLMGDGVWRIDYQMAPNTDPAVASRDDVVRERLQRQFGQDIECDIVWVGPYAYKSQCLHHLNAGRVFFAGDTAKVVSPFGARGGNTGIADAHNLAWKIAAVVKNQAPAQLLHSYNDERLEAAQVNVKVTQRTARFLRPADGTERLFRNAAIALAKRHAFARPLINTGRMAVANRYHRSRVCAQNGGISVQNAALHDALGNKFCLNDLLRWADGQLLLLLFGDLTATDLKRVLQLTPHAPLRAVQVIAAAGKAQAVEHVRDPQQHLRQACHAGQARWALLRPDAYVAATGSALDGRWIQAVGKALAMSD